MSLPDDGAYPMREPCRYCGSTYGHIVTRNGQDCVYCQNCGKHNYNAPRVETGRAVRSLATRPDIKPSRKWRILDAHAHRCVSCGCTGELQLAHLISRDDADRFGFLDEIIDSDLNLAPMCPECNSGQRPHGSVSVQLMYRCMLVAQKRSR